MSTDKVEKELKAKLNYGVGQPIKELKLLDRETTNGKEVFYIRHYRQSELLSEKKTFSYPKAIKLFEVLSGYPVTKDQLEGTRENYKGPTHREDIHKQERKGKLNDDLGYIDKGKGRQSSNKKPEVWK